MPPKFFITHSWKDIDFTRRLCDDLHQHGLTGFFDAYSIKPGDMIPAEIARGLEACDVYVPILSYAALASPWCDEEINAAITLGKMPGRNGRPRIIPLLIENCQDKMSVFLRNRRYIVFVNRYAEALHELLTKGFGVQPKLRVADPPKVEPQPKIVVPPTPKIITPPPGKIATPPRSFVHPKTGTEMILIPAGEFVMGEDKEAHKVSLDSFYMAHYPVTNAEYKKFVDATNHDVPFVDQGWAEPYSWNQQTRTFPARRENHPVVLVSWNDVVAYCEWAGVRLPTEAEWEKAASWDVAKSVKRAYPWGDKFDASKCNTSESKIGDTTQVGKYSPQGDSAYGIADMAGNVWEWCSSLYQAYPYRADDGREDLRTGGMRVRRGGSWFNFNDDARCASRSYNVNPDYQDDDFGFRVAEFFPT